MIFRILGILASRDAGRPAPAPAPAPADAPRETTAGRGSTYVVRDINKVRYYGHITSDGDLPPIYAKWAKTSEIRHQKDDCYDATASFSKATGIEIHPRSVLNLPNKKFKEFVNIEPQSPNAYFVLAVCESGQTAVSSMPATRDKIQAQALLDQARRATAGNRTLAEELDHIAPTVKGGFPMPPMDYNELLKALGTYCAENFVKWGPRCDHFVQVMNIIMIMKLPVVEAKSHKFSPRYCTTLWYEVSEDSCGYFSHQVTLADFEAPGGPVFPKSTLPSIFPNVRKVTELSGWEDVPLPWRLAAEQRQTALASLEATDPERGASLAGYIRQAQQACAAPWQGLAPPMQFPAASCAAPAAPAAAWPGTLPAAAAWPALPPAVPSAPAPAAPAPAAGGGEAAVAHVHPTFRTVLAGVYARDGTKVLISRIMRAGGKAVKDLPTPQGGPVCWARELGECSGQCNFKKLHATATPLTAADVAKAVEVLRPCIEEYLRHPKDKFKPSGQRGGGGTKRKAGS